MSDNNQHERIDRRLRYFDNQFLLAKDFEDEQRYHLDRQRRLIRHMFEPGVVEGLEVTIRSSGQGPSTEAADTIVVSPGTAIDSLGQQIVLTRQVSLAVADPTQQLVVIRYDERPADEEGAGSTQNSRYHELPEVALIDRMAVAHPSRHYVVLAELEILQGTATIKAEATARSAVGMRVRGPLSVGGSADVRGGFTVSAGDVELRGGLTVSGGLTTLNQGLTVNGALTTLNQGLTVNGALTTLNHGLMVSGAVTTLDQGLTVTGNTGIGTKAPEAALHIARSSANDAQVAVGLGAAYGAEKADLVLNRRHAPLAGFGYAGPLIDLRASNSADEWSVAQILGVSGGQYTGSLALLTSSGGETSPAGSRTKGASPAIRMVIREGGDVGVGTTTPTSRLSVAGGLAVGATYAAGNTAPANGLIVEGNVGIGTSAPGSTLHVANATAQTDLNGARLPYGEEKATLVLTQRHSATKTGFYGGYAASLIDFRATNASNQWSIGQILGIADLMVDGGHGGGLAFLTTAPGGIENPSGGSPADSRTIGRAPEIRMVIDARGKVGIGTLAPSALLHINGEAKVQTGYVVGSPDYNTVTVAARVRLIDRPLNTIQDDIITIASDAPFTNADRYSVIANVVEDRRAQQPDARTFGSAICKTYDCLPMTNNRFRVRWEAVFPNVSGRYNFILHFVATGV